MDRSCETVAVTALRTSEVEKRRSAGIRRIGWLAFPAAGVAAAIGADIVHVTSSPVGVPWAPTLVPSHAGYTVAPWPALIWLALVLALASSLAACGMIVQRSVRRRPWWIRALVLWGCTVVVALGVAAVAQSGQWLLQVRTFGGLGGSFMRTFTVPALLEALRWGLMWGWVPAAVGAAFSTAPSSRPPQRRRAVVAGVVAIVAACMFLAAATYGAALSARTEVAQPNEPAPAAPAATDPPEDVAPTVDPGFPGRCSPEDLVVTIAGVDAAAGSRYLALEARNVAAEACALNGSPDLAFASPDGDAVRPTITHRDYMVTGEAISDAAVTLEPGAAVRADLVWRAPTGRPTEITVLMAPWAGAERTAAMETLDIVDGAEVSMTRWYAPK